MISKIELPCVPTNRDHHQREYRTLADSQVRRYFDVPPIDPRTPRRAAGSGSPQSGSGGLGPEIRSG
jgi:hypothetical protein